MNIGCDSCGKRASMLGASGRVWGHCRECAEKFPDAYLQVWFEMDSAPKDGSEIILCLGEPWDEIVFASWYEPWGVWITQGDNRFHISEDDESFGIGSEIPTHWMPKPSRPNQRK